MNEPFEYLKSRVEEQRKWHSRKAMWNKRRFYVAEITTLLAGAAIPVVNVVGMDSDLAGVLSAVFGGVVVVAASVGKLFKFQENWLQYRTLAEALEREEEFYKNGVADYRMPEQAARDRVLVERVEGILASSVSQFVTTHRTGREAAPAQSVDAPPG